MELVPKFTSRNEEITKKKIFQDTGVAALDRSTSLVLSM